MKPKAVLTTIPSDSHNWNLIFIQLFLEESGFEVINLGACVPYELLEETCRQNNPDTLVVSTINGHGFIEGKELIGRIRSLHSMANTDVFIGGKLSVDVNRSYLYALELEQAGYTKVYCDNQDFPDFEARLLATVNRLARQSQPIPADR